MTKGGTYRPGHDAKALHNKLVQERGPEYAAKKREYRHERRVESDQESEAENVEYWNGLKPLHGKECGCAKCALARLTEEGRKNMIQVGDELAGTKMRITGKSSI